MSNDQSTTALSEETEQLRRFLNHVSYSGMGVDRQLDEHLKHLRQSLKKQASVDDLKYDVDSITNYLRELEESVEMSQHDSVSDSLSALSLLVDELLKQNVDKKLNKRLKKIRARSNASVDEVVAELKQVITELAEKDSSSTSSWNPFSRNKKKNDESADSKQSRETKQESDDKSKAWSNQIPDSILDALNNFVEQLGNIDIYRKATQSIKQQLKSLQRYEQLTPLIEQIASVLLEAANQEHAQFESFLQQLNKRLLNVASYLNKASLGNDGLLADTKQLNDELAKTIIDIKQEVNEAPGLGNLKQKLLLSFEHIFDSVGRFRDSQNNRVKTSMSELAIIKEQLQATEDEASRLKNNLKEQRFRAYNDPLTQLPNRYAYNERLTQEYTRWRRYRSPLSLAVADIDYFKKVNDQYGHSAGDRVLKHVAEVLEHGIRESDFIARYGGEEFIVLMPETQLADATKAINKLRLLIKNEKVHLDNGDKLDVTLSFGVAEFEGTDTATDVFNKADKALYRAKQKGRNQVCCERSSGPQD
ncbi:GGDEF domain-containing protein [Pleionea mediterranea]|uniref:diguanylate cyclase n=1 Tax=Pleionea mediterranea TaxID=523701 RepID=A0A316FWA4_9GAMM|nr:GGDEF domain-containing protein [Pleionea mediterranea]PWK52868.1 diguanylate cyclase [Pleionea mediterranea]